MGVREVLDKRKNVVTVIAILAIVVAGYVIFTQARQTLGTGDAGDAFFTVDDGKTFFAGDANLSPPFEKDGKQAVRAHVFECGGQRVVGYLSRYTERAQKALAEAKAAKAEGKAPTNIGELSAVGMTGTEVKKPGETAWVTVSDPRAQQIRTFRCPDGAAPTELQPQ
jgi:hypothetical protein